eukprot:13530702-Ditylum_brightwellii.AAC.1
MGELRGRIEYRGQKWGTGWTMCAVTPARAVNRSMVDCAASSKVSDPDTAGKCHEKLCLVSVHCDILQKGVNIQILVVALPTFPPLGVLACCHLSIGHCLPHNVKMAHEISSSG